MSNEIPELSKNEFESYTKSGLTLIDFFAEWCMPCVMMSPVLEELSEKFKGKIKFGKINVDDNQILAQKFNVASIPNFVLFKDGKKAEQFIGAMPIEDFEKKLKKFA
ncbi:MAG: thioredoxin [Nanoarchaeota archaeon]